MNKTYGINPESLRVECPICKNRRVLTESEKLLVREKGEYYAYIPCPYHAKESVAKDE